MCRNGGDWEPKEAHASVSHYVVLCQQCSSHEAVHEHTFLTLLMKLLENVVIASKAYKK